METLGIIVNIVLILASVALIAVVLMQETQSAGLGGAFGGVTASFTARGRRASREAKLQKITIVLGAVIGVLAIAMMIIG